MASMGSLWTFLAVIACFIFCFLHYLINNKGLPRNWPLVGMMLELFLNLPRIQDKLVELLELSHCNFSFEGPWLANLNMFITVDPVNVQYVMSTNFSNYAKGPKFKKIFDILGDGFFNADSESWRNQRKMAHSLIVNKGFYRFLVKIIREKMQKGMIPVLDNAAKNHSVVDFQDLLQRLGNDITWTFVTGYDPESLSTELPNVDILKALDDAEEAIFHRHIRPVSLWKFQSWLGVGKEGKMKRAWEIIDKFIAEYLSTKRESMKEVTKAEKMHDQEDIACDLLTSYIKAESSMGLEFNDKFLRDTILNFLVAGRESISTSLNWFFWILATKPEVEAKIREELQAISQHKDAGICQFLDVEEISKLVYLHAALSETVRLYPPVPFQNKAPVRPDILPSGHRVDTNTKIMIPRYAMGRMSSIWGKDSHEFMPERWLTEQGEIKHESSYKFFSFNAGPRICPGKEISFIQLKGVAATIIYNYDIKLVEGHPVVPSNSVVLHMKYGMKVMVFKK